MLPIHFGFCLLNVLVGCLRSFSSQYTPKKPLRMVAQWLLEQVWAKAYFTTSGVTVLASPLTLSLTGAGLGVVVVSL